MLHVRKMNFRGENLTNNEKIGSKLAFFDSSFFKNNHCTMVVALPYNKTHVDKKESVYSDYKNRT